MNHLESQILSLKIKGLSIEDIADSLEIKPKRVRNVLNRKLEQRADESRIETLRQVENARLDAMQEKWWDLALALDKEAADVVLKIHDRRVKLNGVAEPERHESTINVNLVSALEQIHERRAVVDAEFVEVRPSEIRDGSTGRFAGELAEGSLVDVED